MVVSNQYISRFSRRAFLLMFAGGVQSFALAAKPSPSDDGDVSPYCYTKGLRRRGITSADWGEADPSAYAALVAALDARDPVAWRALSAKGYVGATSRSSPLTPLVLINPLARDRMDFETIEQKFVPLPLPPDFRSETMGAELAEVYWMALLRDAPLTPGQDKKPSPDRPSQDDAYRDLVTNYRFFRDFHGPNWPLPQSQLFRAAIPGNPDAFPGVGDGPWLVAVSA